MPTASEWRVTLVNLALCGAAVGYLHTSTAFNSWLGDTYAASHGVLSHRMTEGVVSVASFAIAAFFYSFVDAFGVLKLQTASVQVDKGTLVVRAATAHSTKRGRTVGFSVGKTEEVASSFLPSTSAATFAFWLVLNVGLYLGLIDVSQRILGDSIADLHFAPADAPSVLRMVTEVAFSVWAYDFVFWWIHASWHATFPVDESTLWGRVVRRWRSWHLQHHDHYKLASEPLHPMATFHHHFLDAAGQVGINILVQQIPLGFLFPGPRHKLSKVLHNVAVTYLLVEAHCGFDLPWMSHRLFPALFGGSVRHQIHHQHGTVYFHQFFRYLDDWFYGASSTGAGLKKLVEAGGGDVAADIPEATQGPPRRWA